MYYPYYNALNDLKDLNSNQAKSFDALDLAVPNLSYGAYFSPLELNNIPNSNADLANTKDIKDLNYWLGVCEGKSNAEILVIAHEHNIILKPISIDDDSLDMDPRELIANIHNEAIAPGFANRSKEIGQTTAKFAGNIVDFTAKGASLPLHGLGYIDESMAYLAEAAGIEFLANSLDSTGNEMHRLAGKLWHLDKANEWSHAKFLDTTNEPDTVTRINQGITEFVLGTSTGIGIAAQLGRMPQAAGAIRHAQKYLSIPKGKVAESIIPMFAGSAAFEAALPLSQQIGISQDMRTTTKMKILGTVQDLTFSSIAGILAGNVFGAGRSNHDLFMQKPKPVKNINNTGQKSSKSRVKNYVDKPNAELEPGTEHFQINVTSQDFKQNQVKNEVSNFAKFKYNPQKPVTKLDKQYRVDVKGAEHNNQPTPHTDYQTKTGDIETITHKRILELLPKDFAHTTSVPATEANKLGKSIMLKPKYAKQIPDTEGNKIITIIEKQNISLGLPIVSSVISEIGSSNQDIEGNIVEYSNNIDNFLNDHTIQLQGQFDHSD